MEAGGAAGKGVLCKAQVGSAAERVVHDTFVQVSGTAERVLQDTFVQVGGTAERVLQGTVVQVGGAEGRWCCKKVEEGTVVQVGGAEGRMLQDTVVQQEEWCMTPNDTHLMLYFITFSTEHSELC